MLLFRLLFVALVFLVMPSCHRTPSSYLVARDPTWSPLDFKEKNASINAFINALFQAEDKMGMPALHLVDTTWEGLWPSLQRGDVAALVTALTPSPLFFAQYECSDPFLLIGPVLVMRADMAGIGLDALKDKIVAVSQYDESVLIVQRYPSIAIQTYEQGARALERLAAKEIDGVLLNNLDAQALVPHFYAGVLRIASPPLTKEGLRLVTLKGKHPKLLKTFNQRLKKLEANGTYDHLRTNFGVY